MADIQLQELAVEELAGGGATRLIGAGGYSGGAGISLDENILEGGKDGLAGAHIENASENEYYYSGGGYFNGPDGIDAKKVDRAKKCLGGFMGMGANDSIYSSNGGIGGSGGSVVLTGTSKVSAYNGNKYTDELEGQEEALVINAQEGISIEKYSYSKVEGRKFTLSKVSRKKKVKTTSYGQGIGSGAGYIEGNNGYFRDNTKKD